MAHFFNVALAQNHPEASICTHQFREPRLTKLVSTYRCFWVILSKRNIEEVSHRIHLLIHLVTVDVQFNRNGTSQHGDIGEYLCRNDKDTPSNLLFLLCFLYFSHFYNPGVTITETHCMRITPVHCGTSVTKHVYP